MKVYIIEYNNMEAWSDYSAWIGEVFLSREEAEQFLLDGDFEVSKHATFYGGKYFVLHHDDYNSTGAEIFERMVGEIEDD